MDLEAAFPAGMFSYRRAMAEGVPREKLRQAVRRREVTRTSRGVYSLPTTQPESQERWQFTRVDHLRRLQEALHRFPTAVASHTSAAVLHGLELVVSPRAEVELTVVDAAPRSRRDEGVVLHHADSTSTPWVDLEGMRATAVPRTIADVLRTRRPPHAVAMLDQAIRADVVTQQHVVDELNKQHRWRGRPRALRSVALADPARESWLETYSFVALHEVGMPLPLPQVDVLDEGFRFVGRVDGLLPHGVFVEADGEGKYFLDADPEHPLSDAVQRRIQAERARHARLEGLGLVGVRWTSREILREPLDVTGKLNVAQRKARAQAFRGFVRIQREVGRLQDFASLWDKAR